MSTLTTKGVITLTGPKPGKTLAVMAGVHGNEVCGLKAFEKLIPELQIERGKVHFILGNLRAIEKNVRQTDMNMNRAFRPEHMLNEEQKRSYERARAMELMPFLDEAEALLDVHSSTSKESTPFIICEPHSYGFAERLPFSIRSRGWDILHPGGTDFYMNQQGKVGICIECGSHLEENAPRIAEESIRLFLALAGAIDDVREVESRTQRVIHAYGIHMTEIDFKPSREFADFESLSDGECIGHDGEKPVPAPSGAVIIFCRPCGGPAEEAFVLAKEER